MLPPGKYRTKNGSTMTVSGMYGGITHVSFDWLEEGGCCDCHANPYDDEGYLTWDCDECGGGKAKLDPEVRYSTFSEVIKEHFGDEMSKYFHSSDKHKLIEGDTCLRYRMKSSDVVELYLGGNNGEICVKVCSYPEELDRLIRAIIY